MGMGLKLDRLFTMLNPAPTYTDNKLVPQISARCLLGTLCEHPKACALRFLPSKAQSFIQYHWRSSFGHHRSISSHHPDRTSGFSLQDHNRGH